ncbi:MAG TPA: UDP-N-acetylmuramoyl-tripeptide--D-alanyl-D-alanine ligase, partial [Atopostipes sp.]|nr:UDP-N-acetylmuramoyl-tripeptide--D-alanyl-D-alanine ligase [Atopostipes sp.]
SIQEAVELDKYTAFLLYGEEMEALYSVLKERENSDHVFHFTGDKAPLVQMIEAMTESGDAVLFKSSNGTDLLSVVEELKEEEE